MKKILSKLAYTTLALVIYTSPAHAAWTAYSVKDGSNRMINRNTTCEYRMISYPSWQYSGKYTLNRTPFDFVDYQYNYQISPSYQSITFSFRVDEAFADRLTSLIPTNGTVNLGGGLFAGGNGNRSTFLSYMNHVRNGSAKFNCSLTTDIPASGAAGAVAPYLTCTQRLNGSDAVAIFSHVIDPAYVTIQENCI